MGLSFHSYKKTFIFTHIPTPFLGKIKKPAIPPIGTKVAVFRGTTLVGPKADPLVKGTE